jgi:hypothetical protein
MTDWDAVFGESALGLDLARLDVDRDRAPSHDDGRASAQAVPDPDGDPAAEPFPVIRLPPAAPRSLPTASRPATSPAGRDSIFRQEALEFHARGRDAPGSMLRLDASWIQWAYRAALVLLAAAVTSMWVIRADEGTTGPVVVNGRAGAVAILLPEAAGPGLAGEPMLTVTLPGGRSVRVAVLRAQVADGAAISRAGLAPTAQPAILVTGRLSPGTAIARDARGQGSVVLRREPLADVLARQLGAMLGHSGAKP